MKVLVLPSWYPPRGGEFFREHSRALAAEGLEVYVLFAAQTSLGKHGLKTFLTGNDIQPYYEDINTGNGSFCEIKDIYRSIPLLYKANVAGWIDKTCSMAFRWIRDNGLPDLIQVHSSIWAGVAAARVSLKTGVPYIITEHRSRFVCNTPEARNMFLPWHGPMLRQAFSEATGIVTVSDALQKTIINMLESQAHAKGKYRLSEPLIRPSPETVEKRFMKEIVTIPNMVDTRFFHPAKQPPPPSPFMFFTLAHLEPVKGIDLLLEAMSILDKRHPGKYRLTIGGDGSQSTVLKEQAQKLGVNDVISFTGALSRDQVKAYMHRSHAFVLPSHFEAFGVVFIEAMACGLPVIATRSGGPETFIGKDVGIIVDAGNTAQLVTAMEQLAENIHAFSRDEIWNHTITHYSPKAIAGRYIALYEKLILSSHRI